MRAFSLFFLKLSFWFDETLYIFTFLSETVKKKTFFVKLSCREAYRYYMVCHEILWPVLCKKWGFSCKPHLFLFFIVAQFHVKTGWNWWFFFCFIWLKKWNWLMVSWVKTGIKLWNRPEVGREKKWNWRHAVSGKKMKLTARGCAAAVSFIFFPDRLWTVS